MRALAFVCGFVFLLISGCGPTHYWYGNTMALRAEVSSPVAGGIEERTFVEPTVKGKSLGSVYIAPANVKLTRKEGLPADLATKIAGAFQTGAAVAVNASKRFKGLAVEEKDADEILQIDAQAHVAVSISGGTVMPDPVFGDTRSRITVVYTLKDSKTGAVLVKHCTVESSYWEYTQRVTDDMVRLAMNSGENLMYIFSEM